MFHPARLVFIDETSTNTAMVRLAALPRGIRLTDHVPHGHWKTIAFIAGLRRRAMVAPFVLDGPMNRHPWPISSDVSFPPSSAATS